MHIYYCGRCGVCQIPEENWSWAAHVLNNNAGRFSRKPKTQRINAIELWIYFFYNATYLNTKILYESAQQTHPRPNISERHV